MKTLKNWLPHNTDMVMLFKPCLKKCLLFITICLLMAFKSGTATNRGTIYLTFDDGPGTGSKNINEVLLKEQVKASVFIIGQYALLSEERAVSVLRYRDNKYVEGCNHSYTHLGPRELRFYRRPYDILDDLAVNEYLLGFENQICRLPGQNAWVLPDTILVGHKVVLPVATILQDYGYRVFGWDVEWRYSGRPPRALQSAELVYNNIDKAINNRATFRPGHLVFLCEDRLFESGTAKAELTKLIQKLKAENYRFEWLSNYPLQLNSISASLK